MGEYKEMERFIRFVILFIVMLGLLIKCGGENEKHFPDNTQRAMVYDSGVLKLAAILPTDSCSCYRPVSRDCQSALRFLSMG